MIHQKERQKSERLRLLNEGQNTTRKRTTDVYETTGRRDGARPAERARRSGKGAGGGGLAAAKGSDRRWARPLRRFGLSEHGATR